ncbi:LysR family transcriptional regulator [Pseudoalteromonas fenneropenaei]|uniref:LysR family transcriptional regulator n=1 Tax=Pseudoalteromonas fenneropenaei TaxID=1737459 RepID=A0ABV7CP60_9GAMM
MLKTISTFLKVVECGSLSKAAEVLGVSPSAVSRQISHLEDKVEGKLLKRTARSLALTEIGQEYYKQASKIIKDIENLNSTVKSHSTEIKGTLSISVFESFGLAYISPLLPKFLKQHPNLSIELDLNNDVVDLYRKRFDVGIRLGVPKDSSLVVRPLVRNNLVLCASPAYLREHGVIQHPNQLTMHNCLSLSRNGKAVKWNFCKGAEEIGVEVRGNLLSAGGQVLIEAARQDLGYILLPEWVLYQDLREGRLVRCLDDWEANIGRTHVYVFYLKDSFTQKTIQAFIDFLRQELPSQFVI